MRLRKKGRKRVFSTLIAITLCLSLGLVIAPFFSLAIPSERAKVLIGFKKFPGVAEQALIRGLGGTIKYTYRYIPVMAVTLPEVAIGTLRTSPKVRYVEPDGKVRATQQTLHWGVDRVEADLVWASGNKGYEVKVSILDTGIDYSHPDLHGNYVEGYDFVNEDSDPMDDNGHGTHVAGIIAAEDNGIGVVGVAPEASLYAVKVLDENGSGYVSDVIAGIEWCINNGIQIINMSFGSDLDSQALHDACDKAYERGILLVAAAGNDGNPPGKGDNVDYPARYDSVIAVAATDINDERARWSSTGPQVELAAPGVNILSTYLGEEYKELSGTSMAAPHVTGVAALVIASGVASGASAVRNQLDTTAEDLGPAGRDTKYGYGLVNAANAVGISPPPSSGGIMHVASIDMDLKERSAGPNLFVSAVATVALSDDSGNPVEGATVYGHWSGATTDTDSGITDANGIVTVESDSIKNPDPGTTFTFTVDDVTKEGWTYDPTVGETSDSISVSSTNTSLSAENQTTVKFSVHQNYPNPFNPQTTIEYDIPEDCHVTLKIYNMAGELVRTLVNEYQTAGHYSVIWHGDNDQGEEVASGVYFYQLQAGNRVATRKMVVLK